MQLSAQNVAHIEKNCDSYLQSVIQIPNSNSTPNNYFQLGECYMKSGQETKAIKLFKNIIKSKYYEWSYLSDNPKEYRWHNYKHNASRNLYHIYNKKKDYKNALDYYTLSRKVHREFIDCGTGLYLINVREKVTYGELLLMNNNYIKAKENILYHAFEDDIFDKKYQELLFKIFNKKNNLLTTLDKALNKINREEPKYENYPTRFYIIFLGAKILLPEAFENEHVKFNKEKTFNKIHSSKFYLFLKELK